ncbi:ArsB/NhaD family transporter [Pseudothermotoga thermarum]|uniref:Citrate transporter n=1 Tax=Pseudothermotoga thermarum DSM 5069 TaxID=688269 RepID=F7YTU6_9THEM|nr:SLC13 family permease [Pseudothermotoga thermarum]AEH51391.1 Citrate transporter [Pseudothermotoga thermarum DSM 5069]
MHALISIVVFIVVISLVIWGRIHRFYAGLLGVVALLILGVLTPEDIIRYADFNVACLLIGMGIIAYYMEKSGIAAWIAIKFVKKVGRDPFKSLYILSVVGSLISALLDNVSTTILLAPIAINIARSMGVSIVPFVVGVALGANLVGAALMIGDPPSMMVASALDLSFTDFIVFKGKPSIFFIIMVAVPVASATLLFTARSYIDKKNSNNNLVVPDEKQYLKDKVLIAEVISVFTLVVILLSIRSTYNIPLWFPPLLGALLITIMRIRRNNVLEPLRVSVDWLTIGFIVEMTILTGALYKTGVIDTLASYIHLYSRNNIVIASSIIIWASVLISAFIDNIPYFATMIPLVVKLSEISGMNIYTLMWALLLGGSLGGNCTYIGAAANAVAVGIVEKNERKVTFVEFVKLGVPHTVTAVLIGQILHYILYILLP